MRVRALGAVMAVAILCLAGCGGHDAMAAARSGGPAVRVIQAPSARRGSFVSLVPACACTAHTELEQFSIASGRRLRLLDAVSAGGLNLATPAAQANGWLLLTFTAGPRCALSGVFAECPKVAPDSCVNRVESLTPGRGGLTDLFTEPGSVQIGEVVPNRSGSRVVFSQTPCTRERGRTGLYVRELASGRQWPVMTRSNACDGFGPAAFNRAATMLVFPFNAATGPAGRGPDGTVAGCPDTRSHLAIATLASSGAVRHVRLISPAPGCGFAAASFDGPDVLAVEGCRKGGPAGYSVTNLGDAFLVRLTLAGRVTARIALKKGVEQALIAAEPHARGLLVTQDQPANNGTPEDDWIWEYKNGRLRPIAHYHANDAAQVIAIPW